MSINTDYGRNGFGVSIEESSTPDTDRLLEEASEIRSRNIAVKTHDSSDVSTALEALNNVFKAFNTITDMNGLQECENNTMPGDSSINPSSNTLSNADNSDSGQSDPDLDNALNGSEMVRSLAGSATKDSCPTTASEKQNLGKKELIGDSANSSTANDTEIVQKIEAKLHFMSNFSDDESRIRALKRIKQKLSVFPSYEALILHIYKYIYAQGNRMDAEVFFLFHTVYTMENPEKYHHFIRRSLFGNDYYSAGRAEDINMFLDSLPT